MGGAVDVHGAALFPGLGVARKIIILGGGTAGWVTACYLARMLSADLPGGAQITLIESPDIGAIGVGEGTFPSIRKTLNRIGLDERLLFQEADATFKQGIRFVDWAVGKDEYYHLFAAAHRPEGLDLLPYWLLGEAGDRPWGEMRNAQAAVVDAMRGPKLPYQGDYDGALTYAYHFDAIAFAAVLQRHAVTLGVTHIADKVTGVCLAGDGAIDRLVTQANGELTADLYIDCTGFSAQLIGKALGIPFISRRDQLFVDRAVTVQLPYADASAPIQSCTISKAERAGWMWDIGLRRRRGVGYVYSSDHCGDDEAARVLAGYTGQQGKESSFRLLKFEAGYRDVQWHRNCVAIGLSAGFMEPLEATGIGFAESAALLLAALFPWNGPMEPAAVQFNAAMRGRYANVLQFIKAHYCLTKRRDSDFWIDNCRPESIPDGLKDKLERWRYRVPDFVDVDYGVDTFIEDNWRQVIYGMGFRTDLTARAGALRHHDAARRAFAAMDTNRARAVATLPPHRELVEQYSAGQSARMQAR
jgi:glycine/D-amino acid oxidase-like deaminating enzyme